MYRKYQVILSTFISAHLLITTLVVGWSRVKPGRIPAVVVRQAYTYKLLVHGLVCRSREPRVLSRTPVGSFFIKNLAGRLPHSHIFLPDFLTLPGVLSIKFKGLSTASLRT